ncbi:hypothetical protein Lesp02_04460 [Lentzea sp. NBRC 105346]|uniref:hypothetical protein n=1 Tax=Lentzea sp. NBRC 105346 TaxID=3032205 RepID=UPI0024A5B257|nr:hypothetical protein [Lentzea sp. NBRC 105346]GLZ28256.1 hypothetical protein Lesp02_04460 [Lentzea sp. NBRC 105346]
MDVVVWPASGPVSYADAAARYAELRASPSGAVEPRVAAFHRELLETSPDPGASAGWALTVGSDAIIVHLVWQEPLRMLELVRLLASRHGLACYVPSRQQVLT